MRILNVYRKDSRNVGDMKTSPLLYFEFGAAVESVDVMEAANGFDLSPYEAVIFGGGGLLQNQWVKTSLAHIVNKCRGKKILWGAGLNTHFFDETIHFAPSWTARRRQLWEQLRGRQPFIKKAVAPRREAIPPPEDAWLGQCELAGVRDYGTKFDWLPCVSCMDERLDFYRQVSPRHELVVIDHPDFCKIELKQLPHFSNINNDFESILSFVASGETILSSSYHAAYWASLLGRKVVVVPWSEKFYRFKHEPVICFKPRELAGAVARARAYPEALSECRERNREFAGRVAQLLGVSCAAIKA